MEESRSTWILSGPVCLSMLANAVFLVNIVRVLVTKLRAPASQSSSYGTHQTGVAMTSVNGQLQPRQTSPIIPAATSPGYRNETGNNQQQYHQPEENGQTPSVPATNGRMSSIAAANRTAGHSLSGLRKAVR